jgi:hypothetical protein
MYAFNCHANIRHSLISVNVRDEKNKLGLWMKYRLKINDYSAPLKHLITHNYPLNSVNGIENKSLIITTIEILLRIYVSEILITIILTYQAWQ